MNNLFITLKIMKLIGCALRQSSLLSGKVFLNEVKVFLAKVPYFDGLILNQLFHSFELF